MVTLVRRLLALSALFLLAACSAAVTPAPTVTVTLAPTAQPTPSPTPTPPPTTAPASAPPVTLSGQGGVTTALTEPGTIGLTLAAFVKRWNTVLDQGQYPLTGAPTRSGPTFQYTPGDAQNTILLGVLNDDGTVRAVDALSVAGGIGDTVDRLGAQLEAVVIWSTLGRAANPNVSEAEGNLILTNIGLQGDDVFGTLTPAVLDLKGVRYYIIEGDTTTNFIARQAN
jgi:hypothetical protein